MKTNDITVRLANFFNNFNFISDKTKNIIFFLAFLVLIVGVHLSILNNPKVLSDVNWNDIFLIIVAAVPLTILLNALEFMLSGKLISVSITLPKALEITILGSAANMFPLPGSAMVRIASLKSSGAGYKKSTLVTLLVALLWIASAFLFAGLSLSIFFEKTFEYLFLFVGFVSLIAAGMLNSRIGCKWSIFNQLIYLKFCIVIVEAVRVYWCFLAFNIDVSLNQAAIFVVSGVLGSATSIVPAGLGIREVVSAMIAPLVGITASAGFLAATLNRILGLAVLILLTGGLFLSGKFKKM